MEITIKRNGWNAGTVGWLAAGLKSGTITLEEGTSKKSGNHGLWLSYTIGERKKSQVLAMWNQHGLTVSEWRDADSYNVYDHNECGHDAIFTAACWETLTDIAQQWCDSCNKERENDPALTLTLSRITVAEAVKNLI